MFADHVRRDSGRFEKIILARLVDSNHGELLNIGELGWGCKGILTDWF